MAFYDWQNCPVEVRAQVDGLTSKFATLFNGQVVGIYLHGSLAMGGFNPNGSDLDLIVITNGRLSLTLKRQVIEYLLSHSRKPQPIEISFLTHEQINPWQYPTRYALHYSEVWRESYTRDLNSGGWEAWELNEARDSDLAAHFTVLHARGICLAGLPIAAVLPAVPKQDYFASLAGDLDDALESIVSNPVYAILNCCRTYVYVRESKVLSKEEGGRRALAVLPVGLQETVRVALDVYCSEDGKSRFDAARLGEFAAYMRECLAPVFIYLART